MDKLGKGKNKKTDVCVAEDGMFGGEREKETRSKQKSLPPKE